MAEKGLASHPAYVNGARPVRSGGESGDLGALQRFSVQLIGRRAANVDGRPRDSAETGFAGAADF